MILDILDLSELDELIQSKGLVYFRLTGGLGNQLFGLSEAYAIHKNVGMNVAMDIGALEHTSGDEPEWLEWSETQRWLTLVRIPKHVSSKFDLVNLGDVSANAAQLDSKFYTGWIFSLDRVNQAGLFHRGEFPFKVSREDCAESAVHYRVGDYANAKGIGVLDTSYYLEAIKSLDPRDRTLFFSDDNYSAQEMIKTLNHSFATVSSSTSALEVLSQIAHSKSIVAANSTLSWWAIYFSHASKVICPTPFYLQDWKFDSAARFQDAIYISRFKNPFQKMLTWTLWQLRSIRIGDKF